MEGLELLKLKVSKLLGFNHNIINGKYVLEDGKLIPNLSIKPGVIKEDRLEDVGTLIASVWEEVSLGIKEKLDNLDG